MSTKATRSINMYHPNLPDTVKPEVRDPDCPNYHLYQECMEGDQAMYLELTANEKFPIEFEASSDQVMVRIPAAVWDRIVKIGPIASDHTLGSLAMKFRGAKHPTTRSQIAADYAREVNRLIASGAWTEMPSLEDQLPDEYMPLVFYQHWKIRK